MVNVVLLYLIFQITYLDFLAAKLGAWGNILQKGWNGTNIASMVIKWQSAPILIGFISFSFFFLKADPLSKDRHIISIKTHTGNNMNFRIK